MREIKLRWWDKDHYEYLGNWICPSISTAEIFNDYINLEQFTGLYDKNGKDGYFDSDIWEIKGYEYSVPWCNGYKTEKCDLMFVLHKGPLAVEYELLNATDNLTSISLQTIFNIKNERGKRIYVDRNRKNLEIIGNIHENKELLK